MIRMVNEHGPRGCPMVLLGLSHQNLRHLRAGKPIHLDIDQCAALGLGQREVVIYAGEDEIAMMREVEEHELVPPGSTERLAQEFAARGKGQP